MKQLKQAPQGWLTPQDLEDIYGISKSVQAMLRTDKRQLNDKHKLCFVRIGKRILYETSKIEQWLRANEYNATAKKEIKMKDKTTQPPQSVGENCKNKTEKIIAEFSNSVNIEELKNKKVEWLIPNFIPKKTIINIYGKPGTGKSILALYLCKFLLDNDKVKEIYYLDADNTEIVYADRKTYEIMQNHLPKFHLQIFENQIDKKSKYDFVQNFAQRVDDLSDTLLVFDSIRDFMNINMQSDKEVNDFLSNLKTLRAKNATIIFLKQYGDENNKIAKGSTGFTETPDAPYFLITKPMSMKSAKIKLFLRSNHKNQDIKSSLMLLS